MRARGWTLLGAAGMAAAALAPGRAAAQDVEMLSRASGHALPPAYYEQIRRDPGFFELRRGWSARAVGVQPGSGGTLPVVLPVRGNLRMVVVMTLFSDSPEPSVATSVIERQLFGDNPLGNLTQYYREVSGGQVNLTGTVMPWVRTGFTAAQVTGASNGLGTDNQIGAFLTDAVARLDSTVNFGQYDNDGPDGAPNSGDDDGFVDAAVFQFSAMAGSCGGPGIWPHRSSLRARAGQAYATNDLRPGGGRVVVDDYIIQSAVGCDGLPQEIATIAHETGHAFGLPDFYDATGGVLPQQRRWVLGCWSLMAAGSWGCGGGSTFSKVSAPPHMAAYEKLALGWMQRTVAEPGWRREYVLDPVQAGRRVLQVPLRGLSEFLLLEFRPRDGFDQALPAPGVLVYHVQPDLPMRPCAECSRIYRVGLLEADGDGAMRRTALEGGNRGVPGDAFGGTRTLGDFTTPALRLNSGARSNVFLEMDVTGGQARIRVSTLPEVRRERLLSPFLQSGAEPTADERAALDLFGNRNGRYDVGDLSAYARNRPGVLTGG